MSGFCVFGVSMQDCIKAARKKVPAFATNENKKRVEVPQDEWNQQVMEVASGLFDSARAKQISPAFDAPAFCRDWIAVGEQTKQINHPKIMCKGEKVDAKGAPMIRKGKPVIGWIPYQQRQAIMTATNNTMPAPLPHALSPINGGEL